MNENKVATRYAAALLKVAREFNIVEDVRLGLQQFMEIVRGHGDFFLWISDDEIPHAKREVLVRDVATALDVHPMLLNFLEVLIHKDRIRFIAAIAKSFNDQADEATGLLRGRIMVAHRDMGETIRTNLESFFTKKLGKKVVLSVDEESSILGGLMVHIRDRIWDASIKRMLAEMKEKVCQ